MPKFSSRRRRQKSEPEYEDVQGRKQKTKYLLILENEVINQFFKLIKEVIDPDLSNTKNFRPLIQMGLIFEFLYMIFRNSQDRLGTYQGTHYLALMGGSIPYYQKLPQGVTNSNNTIPLLNTMDYNLIPWERLNELALNYANLQMTRRNYIDETMIKKSKHMIKGNIRVKICMIPRSYAIDYTDTGIFHLLLKSINKYLDIPPTERPILEKAIKTGDFNTIVSKIVMYGKQSIDLYLDQITNQPGIKKSRYFSKFHLWMCWFKFLYNLSLIYCLYEDTTKTIWVLDYPEKELEKGFRQYYDFNKEIGYLNTLAGLYENLSKNSYHPFLPFYSYINTSGDKMWVIVPSAFKFYASQLIENIHEFIYEKGMIKGTIFEDLIKKEIKKHGYVIWQDEKTTTLVQNVREVIQEEKGDVDIIFKCESTLIFIQAKTNAPRKRNTLLKSVAKAKTQLEIIMRTVNSEKELFSEFIGTNTIKGLILISHPFMIPFHSGEYNIKLMAFTPFLDLMLEAEKKHQSLVKMLDSFSIESLKRSKTPFIDIGIYKIEYEVRPRSKSF